MGRVRLSLEWFQRSLIIVCRACGFRGIIITKINNDYKFNNRFPECTLSLCHCDAGHLFSQNPATNTENSAQSRSEHIFMELTLFVYNINSKYFCIKSGLNFLRYKRYNRNETEGHIFFCNLNFHRNGIYILYTNCYHHRKIYILHWLVVPWYIEHFWTIIYHINTFE